MALWKPDQTFYPSARMAMQAPREQLGVRRHVQSDAGQWKHDALCVLDLDPKSKTYSQVVGRAEMPKAGDELHHFGWNACSAALCPYAPHPHIERRYLMVPGLAIVADLHLRHQTRPAESELVKTIEPEEIASRDRLQPAAYDPLRARRDLCQRARRSERRRAGRNFPARSRELRRAGAMGGRSRAAAVRLRFLVASRLGRRGHERMGHART